MSNAADNPPIEDNPRQCLNCNTPLTGAFCHHCGQEDGHYVRGIGSLITEFFGEMGNWDGRVWRTLIPLFLRPAFLSNEYVRGRRVPYVPPLRLYLFISIVAFIFFSQLGSGLAINGNQEMAQETAQEKTQEAANRTRPTSDASPNAISAQEDEKEISALLAPQNEDPQNVDLQNVNAQQADGQAGALLNQNSEANENDEAVFIWLLSDEQNAELSRKLQVMLERPKTLVDKFFTVAPQMMLIMLPIFAVFLKIMYIGSRRYYIEHVVLALHTHAFMLVTLLVILGVNLVYSVLLENGVSGWLTWPFSWLLKALWLWVPLYLFLAQKRFYRQSFLVTFIKFNVTALFYMFLLTLTLVLGVIWSIWSA